MNGTNTARVSSRRRARMVIHNNTHWRTGDLRRILTRCAAMEFDATHRPRTLDVTINYVKSPTYSYCSGLAWLNSGTSILRVPKRGVAFNSRSFAMVACHEFAHNRGMEHRQMPTYYNSSNHARYDWAKAFVVRAQAVKVKPTGPALVDVKVEHARKMIARAETRAKRAATILKKWRRKLTYYERKAAAIRPQGDRDGEGETIT